MTKLKTFKVSIGNSGTFAELRSVTIMAEGYSAALVLAREQLKNKTEYVRSVTQI